MFEKSGDIRTKLFCELKKIANFINSFSIPQFVFFFFLLKKIFTFLQISKDLSRIFFFFFFINKNKVLKHSGSKCIPEPALETEIISEVN